MQDISVKYSPVTGLDSIQKTLNNYVETNIGMMQVITAMQEYESKSLEELRYEDYLFILKSSAVFGYNQDTYGMNNMFRSWLLNNQNSGGLFSQKLIENGSQIGTSVKFSPVPKTDTVVKSVVTENIPARYHCITVMQEYAYKSLEELRLAYYLQNHNRACLEGIIDNNYRGPYPDLTPLYHESYWNLDVEMMSEQESAVSDAEGSAERTCSIKNLIRSLSCDPFGSAALLKDSHNPSAGKADDMLRSPVRSSSSDDSTQLFLSNKPLYVLPPGSGNKTKLKPIGISRIPGDRRATITGTTVLINLNDRFGTKSEDTVRRKSFPNLKVFKNSQINHTVEKSCCNDESESADLVLQTPLTTPIASPVDSPTGSPPNTPSQQILLR